MFSLNPEMPAAFKTSQYEKKITLSKQCSGINHNTIEEIFFFVCRSSNHFTVTLSPQKRTPERTVAKQKTYFSISERAYS